MATDSAPHTPPISSMNDGTNQAASPATPKVQGRRPVLDNLPTARRLTGAQAQARSRNVRVLRFILPAIAVAMILTFFITSQGKNTDDAQLTDLAIPDVVSQEATMTRPEFAGIDSGGQPYKITAETATQAANSDKVVKLNAPTATMSDGAASTLAKARTGTFQSDDKILDLQDDVSLERKIRGRTYVLNSSEATVSIDQETVTTKSGVTGQTDNGQISADRMQVYHGEKRIVFEGNVLMKFEPGAVKNIKGDIQDNALSTTPPATTPPNNN